MTFSSRACTRHLVMILEPRTAFGVKYALALTGAGAIAILLMDSLYPHIGPAQWALLHCKLAELAGWHPMTLAIAMAFAFIPLTTRAVTRLVFGH